MLRLFIVIFSIAMICNSTVRAADFSKPSSTPVHDHLPAWSGIYAGLNSGYGFGASSNAQNFGWANPTYFNNQQTSAAYAIANSFPGRNIDQAGFIGGGQLGYTYKINSSVVIGFEADLQGSGIIGTGNSLGIGAYGPNTAFINNNVIQGGISWLGTVRGRVGYLIRPDLLLYTTGGLAYGGATVNTNSSFASIILANGYFGGTHLLSTQNSLARTLSGWTVGAGSEWMLNRTWSLKGETIYYDLGSQSVTNSQYYSNNSTSIHNIIGGSTTRVYYQGLIARVGANYHFSLAKTPTSNLMNSSYNFDDKFRDTDSSSWNTIYVGINSGYGFSTTSGAENYGWANPAHFFLNNSETIAYALSNSGRPQSINQSGFIGGGQIGYNHHISPQIVIGAESDMQGSGISGAGSATGVGNYGSNSYINNNNIQAGVRWFGTARARMGYLVAQNFLAYVTSGLVYGNTYLNTSITPGEIKNGFSGTSPFLSTNNAIDGFHAGWTVGTGTEWMLPDNWSIKSEALYYDLGSQSVSNTQYWLCTQNGISAAQNPVGGSTTRAYYQGVVARLGLNYHFEIEKSKSKSSF